MWPFVLNPLFVNEILIVHHEPCHTFILLQRSFTVLFWDFLIKPFAAKFQLVASIIVVATSFTAERAFQNIWIPQKEPALSSCFLYSAQQDRGHKFSESSAFVSCLIQSVSLFRQEQCRGNLLPTAYAGGIFTPANCVLSGRSSRPCAFNLLPQVVYFYLDGTLIAQWVLWKDWFEVLKSF